MAGFAVGIDVGGTFTDCVVVDEAGSITAGKALSTPPDFWNGVLSSIADAAASLELTRPALLARTRLLVHGTTIAENALVTRSGARAGLITTRGFEDTILIMRGKGRWMGLSENELTHIVRTDKPAPIIPRRMIEGIPERVDSDGEIVAPLDLVAAERVIQALLDRGAESLAISLLWACANPVHEQQVADLAARLAPGMFVTTGASLAPYAGEYERTATVAINAYLGDIAGRYIATLTQKLEDDGLAAPLLITQAYGGALRAEVAARNAVGLIESGPASGMIGSRFVAQALGLPNVIATDMGGTTFKVGIIADGVLEHASEPNFGQYNVMVPKIDVRSLGAGGGSIASVERESGALKVGPRSAGAAPGPACYGLGGTEPTLTDADAVLGYLNPGFFLGGKMALDRDAACRAIEEHIARPLGISPIEAAAGIYTIACSESADLIRKVSIERGNDPREFVLFAYGGAGPVHAGGYAHHLGCEAILVPFTASVHCAMGAVSADVVREYALSEPQRFPIPAAPLNATFERMEVRAREDLASDGFSDASVEIRRLADFKFRRQVHVVRMPVPAGNLDDEAVDRLRVDFERAYERRHGEGAALSSAGVELVTCVLEGTGVVPKPALQRYPTANGIPPEAQVGKREVYFMDFDDPGAPPTLHGDTPIFRLPGLRPGNAVQGPAIIETPVTTILVHPRHRARVDGYLNVLIETGAAA